MSTILEKTGKIKWKTPFPLNRRLSNILRINWWVKGNNRKEKHLQLEHLSAEDQRNQLHNLLHFQDSIFLEPLLVRGSRRRRAWQPRLQRKRQMDWLTTLRASWLWAIANDRIEDRLEPSITMELPRPLVPITQRERLRLPLTQLKHHLICST